MKMINAGAADIYDYHLYSYNCNVGRCKRPFFAPVPTFADVQLYVKFGTIKPTGFTFTKFDLCGGEAPEEIETDCFIVANNGSYWYGIFKNFSSSTSFASFLIALEVTFTSGPAKTYFSEQYQLQTSCEALTKVQVCYPANYNAEDPNEIYIGEPSASFPASGNAAIIYQHFYWVRSAEVIETSNKISFVADWKKNYSTKLNKIFEFRSELVPGWYKDYLTAVYFRGQFTINGVETKASDLVFDLIVEEANLWKAWVKIDKELRGVFGCSPISCSTTDCIPPGGNGCVPVSIVGSPRMPDAHKNFPYSFTIYLTGTPLFFLLNIVKPAWMTIAVVGSTIVFSGTPTASNPGAAVSFKVSNDCGFENFSDSIAVTLCTSEIINPSGASPGTNDFTIDARAEDSVTVINCPRSTCYRYKFTLECTPASGLPVFVGTNYLIANLPIVGPTAGGCGEGSIFSFNTYNDAMIYLNDNYYQINSSEPVGATYNPGDKIEFDFELCCGEPVGPHQPTAP